MDGQNPQPTLTTAIGAGTRDVIRAEVARRMAGSPEPVPLYFVECLCRDAEGNLPDRGKHGYLGEGDFCAKYIRAAVKAQKFGPKDFRGPIRQPEEGDSIRNCATCGCAIVCSPTAYCIESELDHWTDSPGHPRTDKEWREFSLCLGDIKRGEHDPTEEAEWERIVAIMMRETPWRPARERWEVRGPKVQARKGEKFGCRSYDTRYGARSYRTNFAPGSHIVHITSIRKAVPCG